MKKIIILIPFLILVSIFFSGCFEDEDCGCNDNNNDSIDNDLKDIQLFEGYNSGDDTAFFCFGDWKFAQVFHVNESFNVTKINLKISRFGPCDHGNFTVSINSFENEEPSDNSLVSIILDGNDISGSNSNWEEINLYEPLFLSEKKFYCIVLNADYGSEMCAMLWRINSTSNIAGYPEGMAFTSSNNGVTWISQEGDFLFEIYGYKE